MKMKMMDLIRNAYRGQWTVSGVEHTHSACWKLRFDFQHCMVPKYHIEQPLSADQDYALSTARCDPTHYPKKLKKEISLPKILTNTSLRINDIPGWKTVNNEQWNINKVDKGMREIRILWQVMIKVDAIKAC